MSILTPAPIPVQQWFDDNGDPLAGFQLFTYVAGTVTPQTVWQDSAGTVAWTNPIIGDSAGRVPGIIYPPITPALKYVLEDANGVTIWTADNIIASAPSS